MIEIASPVTAPRRRRTTPVSDYAAEDVILAPMNGLAADHPLAAAYPRADCLYIIPHRDGDALTPGKRYLDAACRPRHCLDGAGGPYIAGQGAPGCADGAVIVARIVGASCPEDAPPARRTGSVVAFPFERRA